MTRNKDLLVLGVETSCDDTAAAVVRRRADGSCEILSNEVWAQHEDHAAYGGVVPEIAARSHVERLDGTIARAIAKSGVGFDALDAVAPTAGPGLVGGVMVGLTTAKAIALAHDLTLIPLNHLEGHALSARMTEDAPFPYLLLLISGGHASEDDLKAIDKEIKEIVNASAEFAKESPEPAVEELWTDIIADVAPQNA